MQEQHFDAILDAIIARDGRYQRDAYLFLREALDFTQQRAQQGKKKQPRHVTGQELLEGIREYALQQYGPMALMVFDEWKVRCCEDFGEIVFNLIDAGLLSKTETDSRQDFAGGYDFIEAFRKPYLPQRKRSPVKPDAKETP
ncbi:MAG TPA: hypothetical protein PK256_26895 [Verrucomicrobiota bacterium]|nr:hypothetical protein [Verrucomicrobiota bacterium]